MSARRNELTRTAARLFAEKGYHGASLSEIADALGVKAPSLYAHVESKQEILYAIMLEGAGAFQYSVKADPSDALTTHEFPASKLKSRFTRYLSSGEPVLFLVA